MSEHDPILEALSELGAVELEAVRLEQMAIPVERPVIAGIDAPPTEPDTVVVVELSFHDRRVTAREVSPSTEQAVTRAAATAVLDALAQLLRPRTVEMSVEWIDLFEAPQPGNPAVVHCAVRFRTAGGTDLLVGSAVLRGERHEVAVRAALDAVNRRATPYLTPE